MTEPTVMRFPFLFARPWSTRTLSTRSVCRQSSRVGVTITAWTPKAPGVMRPRRGSMYASVFPDPVDQRMTRERGGGRAGSREIRSPSAARCTAVGSVMRRDRERRETKCGGTPSWLKLQRERRPQEDSRAEPL
eukprot:scaffold68723_cov26-Tisochrysis_lutea.AAC.1